MKTHTYRVDSKAMYWGFVVVGPVFLVAFGSLWICLTASDASRGQGEMWFGVAWLLAALWGSYSKVTMPHSIEVAEAGTIRFVGAFRSSSVEPADVISVRARAGPFMEVRHAGGKIVLLQQFTGFHQFLTELRQVNPRVTVRGL